MKTRTRYNLPVIRPVEHSLTGLQPGTAAFKMGPCRILVSPPFNGMGHHLSISRRDKLPSWEEVQTARYELLPENAIFVMVLPSPDEYVNVHEYCFHLHELLDDKAIWGK